MASPLHLRLSFNIDDAAARKPCAVIWSWEYPSRRSAPFNVFSEIGRSTERSPGNRRRQWPEIACNSFNRLTACGERGTRCGRRIFIRPAGIAQTPASRSNSSHSAFRNSPGLTNMSVSNCRATRVVGSPAYPSMERRRPPKAIGSTIAGRCFVTGAVNAPRSANVGSLSQRPVAMPYLKTCPTRARSRTAVS